MAKSAKQRTCFVRRVILAGVALVWASATLLPAQTIQPFQIQWHKTFGGSRNDWSTGAIGVARDGGYLVSALSDSADSGSQDDCWLLRLDSAGRKVWQANPGGTRGDDLRDVKATSDGGWILVGSSRSAPSLNKTSPNYGQADYWVVRLDDQGNTLWEKSFGGTGFDTAEAVIETADGGFLVVGGSGSDTNEVKSIAPFGSSDVWVLKLSAQGDLLWQRLYGGMDGEWAWAADRWGTNGFVIAAQSGSPVGGNKDAPHYGASDFWIIAIDHDGNKIWERSYGGDNDDQLRNLKQTSDGGFIACGKSRSGVSGNKTTPLAGTYEDIWIIRLDPAGDRLWERSIIAQEHIENPFCLVQTIDGGFVVAGPSVELHAWTVRLDANGTRIWDHNFNATPECFFRDMQTTSDGGLIAVGSTLLPWERWEVFVMKLAPDALTAPHLQLLPALAGAAGSLTLRGIPGRTYVTERTHNFVTWLPFATNTLSANSVELLDPAPSSATRFYRAMMLP